MARLDRKRPKKGRNIDWQHPPDHADRLARRDIGIRMAIGARGDDVVRMFVGEGLILTALGLVIGAFALTRLMTGLLFGVTPTDASTVAAMALLIGVVGFLACYVPAGAPRRSLRCWR